MKNNQKGITLIALIITIIVMLILVGVTINVAFNGGLFDTTREAAKEEEKGAIYDQIISAMNVRNNGTIDVKGTYEDAKEILTAQGKTVALVEPESEGEITDNTTSVIFTVTGKYETFKYQITDTEIKIIEEGTGDDDPIVNQPVVPETYLTSITGLGTNVSLVEYEGLTGNLKTAADNGKIVAVLTEVATVNGATTTLTAVIPTGFTVSTEKTAEADTITGGLVVTDESGNEFVWIPVPEINDMIMCQSAETVPEGQTNGKCTIALEGETLKCTKHHSEALAGRLYATTIANNFDASLTGQTYSEASGFREPEIQYQTEFNTMAKSVKKYGGFYVGRYETSGFNKSLVTVLPNETSNLNKGEWSEMYAMQKEFGDNKTVGSSMIWGCQYDQVMKFVDGRIDGTGEQSFNVKEAANNRHTQKSRATGALETDLVANIYDLEGNSHEWTLEVNEANIHAIRGGYYENSASASNRAFFQPSGSDFAYIGSRMTLYVR